MSSIYLDSSTLTPLLKRLEEKGYVLRRHSKEDERNLIVTITKKGEELKSKAVTVPERLSACIQINETDARTLYNLLYDLLEKLNEKG